MCRHNIDNRVMSSTRCRQPNGTVITSAWAGIILIYVHTLNMPWNTDSKIHVSCMFTEWISVVIILFCDDMFL